MKTILEILQQNLVGKFVKDVYTEPRRNLVEKAKIIEVSEIEIDHEYDAIRFPYPTILIKIEYIGEKTGKTRNANSTIRLDGYTEIFDE